MNGNVESIETCTHVQVTKESTQIEIQVLPSNTIITLPNDGNVVYLMNDMGDTVDTFRSPTPKEEGT
jgi:hypothetical protein